MTTRTKFICLCTPSLGAVSLLWAKSIAEILWPNNIGKVLVFRRDGVGGEIAEMRNALTAQCLSLENDKRELDSIFWVDDDVLITRASLLQLYGHQRPIATGCYFTKQEPGLPLLFPGRLQGTVKFVPDSIQELWASHMGNTLVKAEVYKRMIQELSLPHDKYGCPEWHRTKTSYSVDVEQPDMVDCGGTEDLFFYDNAARLGYKPLVDCGKWAFSFHLDLATMKGYPTEQFAQYSSGKAVRWKTDGGEVVWE